MYDPHNGRLLYARNKIFAVYAHYNFFWYLSGKRNAHSGDTSIFLDAESGEHIG